jgi:hypothetical protein
MMPQGMHYDPDCGCKSCGNQKKYIGGKPQEKVSEWETLKDTINKSIDWREWKQEIDWERIEKAVKSLLTQRERELKAEWRNKITDCMAEHNDARHGNTPDDAYTRVLELLEDNN